MFPKVEKSKCSKKILDPLKNPNKKCIMTKYFKQNYIKNKKAYSFIYHN